MSIISEITTEGMIKWFVQSIEQELEHNKDNLEVCMVLKKLGRSTLTQFEWSTPDWAEKYVRLFTE